MTAFDALALIVLGVSALTGLIRGFVREVVTVAAFVIAAFAAVFGLRFAGPIARAAIDPPWLGSVVAMLVVFFAVYLLVRVSAGGLTRRISQSSVSSLDRAAGLGVGVIRGLVVLGGFYLIFNLITPADRVPAWVGDSWTYPLARQSGQLLARVAPEGFSAAGRIAPTIGRAIHGDATSPPALDEADARDDAPGSQTDLAAPDTDARETPRSRRGEQP